MVENRWSQVETPEVEMTARSIFRVRNSPMVIFVLEKHESTLASLNCRSDISILSQSKEVSLNDAVTLWLT